MTTRVQTPCSPPVHPCGPAENQACAPAASTKISGGEAVFENQRYRITMGDNATVEIHNKDTGDTTRIWGDPHVSVNGTPDFDFHGDTTFMLDDGTKVTIGTKPAKDNPNVSYASTVTIKDGQSNYGARISGIDEMDKGDLRVDEFPHDGKALDHITDDGVTIYQKKDGPGFQGPSKDGPVDVDSKYIEEQEAAQKNQSCRRMEHLSRCMDDHPWISGCEFKGWMPPCDHGDASASATDEHEDASREQEDRGAGRSHADHRGPGHKYRMKHRLGHEHGHDHFGEHDGRPRHHVHCCLKRSHSCHH